MTLDAVDTIADGIATGGISDLTLDLIDAHVDEIVTVSDTEIANAILLLPERAKQVVEGAAAYVAAVLSRDLDVRGETVMPVLGGGNLDMTMLQTLVYARTDRKHILWLRVRIDGAPGKMADLSEVIADCGANIHDVRHDRAVGTSAWATLISSSGSRRAVPNTPSPSFGRSNPRGTRLKT